MKAFLFLSLVWLTNGVVTAGETKPNVLFIAVDDLNACLEGMDGETTVDTPNLNRLAERGTLFSNAHCAAPACNPSRFAVVSGLAPSTSGIYVNQQDWRKVDSLAALATIPHQARRHGYRTIGGLISQSGLQCVTQDGQLFEQLT